MKNVIKSGYRLTVDSWENDADAPRKVVIEGLSKEKVEAYIAFAKPLMKSSWEGPDYVGNMYHPNDEECENFVNIMRPILLKNHQFFEIDEFEDDNDFISDCSHEIIGDMTGYGEFYTRKIQKITVEYIPVQMEIEDVTKEFL